jgi:hypothetical protein
MERKKGDNEREKNEPNRKGNEARNYADIKKDTQRDCTGKRIKKNVTQNTEIQKKSEERKPFKNRNSKNKRKQVRR